MRFSLFTLCCDVKSILRVLHPLKAGGGGYQSRGLPKRGDTKAGLDITAYSILFYQFLIFCVN